MLNAKFVLLFHFNATKKFIGFEYELQFLLFYLWKVVHYLKTMYCFWLDINQTNQISNTWNNQEFSIALQTDREQWELT